MATTIQGTLTVSNTAGQRIQITGAITNLCAGIVRSEYLITGATPRPQAPQSIRGPGLTSSMTGRSGLSHGTAREAKLTYTAARPGISGTPEQWRIVIQ